MYLSISSLEILIQRTRHLHNPRKFIHLSKTHTTPFLKRIQHRPWADRPGTGIPQIGQPGYASRVLERFGMTGCKPVSAKCKCVNVYVYSLISHRVQQTSQFTPLVLELSLVHSHLLWGEFSAFSAAIAIHNSPLFVPPGTHHCWVDRGGMI